MIAALIYLLPFAASLLVTKSNLGLFMVLRENVLRFVEPFDHEGPIYLYAYTIFVLTAPWCLFLPAALVHAHSSKPPGQSDRFVLAYFWATFIFFTLSGSRRDYYLLPILPAAAICSRAVVRFNAGNLEPVGALAGCREAMSSVPSIVLLTVVATGITAFLPSPRFGAVNQLPALLEQSVWFGFWLFLAMLIALVPVSWNLLPQRLASFDDLHRLFLYAFLIRLCVAKERTATR